MDDGVRLAARLFLPGRASSPGHRRRDSVPHGRPHGVVRERVRAALRGGRLRRLPARPPRDGLLGGDRARRVQRAGAGRHLRGDRVARRPGVVHGEGRDVRHVVGRVQLDPGRDGATARAARDRPDLRLGRSLHGRRPLHGRHPQGDRPRRLGDLHGRLQRAAAGARRVRRRLARGVAPPDRGHRAVAPALARGAGRRAVLAPRIASAELRADHVPDDDRRRLGRRLHEHRAARLRGVDLSAARDHRAVGARVHGHVDPGPAHRSRARADPLVLPLAPRRAERHRP